MKLESFIVNTLSQHGVTDVFGIPGGVILKLLREMEAHAPRLTAHLCTHEASAGFAACGYAQAKGSLGVAYATRGPGILNMVTCMAEAWQESIPVLFLTSHGTRTHSGARFDQNQEVDVVATVSGFTKYASNIETIDEAAEKVEEACRMALSGRRGPALLDISASLWGKEISPPNTPTAVSERDTDTMAEEICSILQRAKRPLLLVGDGLRHAIDKGRLCALTEQLGLPALSSRGAQDLLCGSNLYYGYIGSHGLRYSNFILSKADVILSLGNRLAVSARSESFRQIFQKSVFLKVDIDPAECARSLHGEKSFCCDAALMLETVVRKGGAIAREEWCAVCGDLKEALLEMDCPRPVMDLVSVLKSQRDGCVYVCDVGNHEFWLARAFERVGKPGTILCSKSFGTLGAALGRAIGAWYGRREPVICIIGDQGLQYHVQELYHIARKELPICVVVVNNRASGMILDHQAALDGMGFHVTEKNGYLPPDIAAIATCYGLEYQVVKGDIPLREIRPCLWEITCPPLKLAPTLPRGNPCQDMAPELEREEYDRLNRK